MSNISNIIVYCPGCGAIIKRVKVIDMEQNINMFTELIGEGYLLKFEYKDDNHDIFECMCNDNYRIEAQQKYL